VLTNPPDCPLQLAQRTAAGARGKKIRAIFPQPHFRTNVILKREAARNDIGAADVVGGPTGGR
jgi:hypothetical protein